MNKPGCSRGSQVVIYIDSDRIRSWAFLHQHKMHPNPNSFVASQNKIRLLSEKLDVLVAENKFYEQPYLTVDNYFSGDKILNFLGN